MDYFTFEKVEEEMEAILGRGWKRSPNQGKVYYEIFKILVDRIGELEKKVDGHEEPKRRSRSTKAKTA